MWQPLTKNSLMDLVVHGVEVLVVNATNSQLQVCILTEVVIQYIHGYCVCLQGQIITQYDVINSDFIVLHYQPVFKCIIREC